MLIDRAAYPMALAAIIAGAAGFVFRRIGRPGSL
jgi:hypothetical protein